MLLRLHRFFGTSVFQKVIVVFAPVFLLIMLSKTIFLCLRRFCKSIFKKILLCLRCFLYFSFSKTLLLCLHRYFCKLNFRNQYCCACAVFLYFSFSKKLLLCLRRFLEIFFERNIVVPAPFFANPFSKKLLLCLRRFFCTSVFQKKVFL